MNVQNAVKRNFEDAMTNFNFYRVKLAMQALDWNWAYVGIPTIGQMEEEVVGLFENAFERYLKNQGTTTMCGSGGFHVYIHPNYRVRIMFIVEEGDGGLYVSE